MFFHGKSIATTNTLLLEIVELFEKPSSEEEKYSKEDCYWKQKVESLT